MPPSSQKADVRPISFVFHDLAAGTPPVERRLLIRPESLTRSEQSRATVTQTLGGSWADVWGTAIPSVQIAGTTGWGREGLPDGQQAFIDLHETVFSGWHAGRARAIDRGDDPDRVKLIFSDVLDGFTWVVLPQAFVLQRSKSSPLLSRYTISLLWLSDDVSETQAALTLEVGTEALSSFAAGLQTIVSFSEWLSSGVDMVLAPIKTAVAAFTTMTARVYQAVETLLRAGLRVTNTLPSGLIGLASNLARAGANLTRTVQGLVSLPDRLKAKFMRVSQAYQNTECLFANVFSRRQFLPDYSSLYGASNCSSTAGGSPVSRWNTENPFPYLLPIDTSKVLVTPLGAEAIGRMLNYDPVQLPPALPQVLRDARQAAEGVVANG